MLEMGKECKYIMSNRRNGSPHACANLRPQVFRRSARRGIYFRISPPPSRADDVVVKHSSCRGKHCTTIRHEQVSHPSPIQERPAPHISESLRSGPLFAGSGLSAPLLPTSLLLLFSPPSPSTSPPLRFLRRCPIDPLYFYFGLFCSPPSQPNLRAQPREDEKRGWEE